MSKIKTNLAIILIIVGIGIIPIAFLAEGLARDQINPVVPETLRTIESEITSEEEAIIRFNNPFSHLHWIKGNMTEKIPSLVNGTKTAQLLYNTLQDAEEHFDEWVNGTNFLYYYDIDLDADEFALESFFNNQSWSTLINWSGKVNGTLISTWTPLINGTSEVITMGMLNLSYTPLAQTRLFLTGINIPGIIDIPGIIEDRTYGTGVQNFLTAYNLTFDPVIGATVNASMQSQYDATWLQLTYMAAYLLTYMIDQMVPTYYYPTSDFDTYADTVFYEQWANGTFFRTRIDISRFLDVLTTTITGFEIQTFPTRSQLPLNVAIDMWDPANDASFLHPLGYYTWREARTGNSTARSIIINAFNQSGTFTQAQYDYLISGLSPAGWIHVFAIARDCVSTKITQNLLGVDIEVFVYRRFYSQWANASRVPTGIDVGYMFGVASFTGWEIGVPVPSNLYLETIRFQGTLIRPPLWNYQNASSLTNYIGFKKWTDARTNQEIYNELMNIFQLSSSEMATIMSWLETFTDERILNLIIDQSGINLFDLGSILFSGFLFAGFIVVGIGIVFAVYATLVQKKER